MRRQILLLTTNIVAAVLLTICVGATTYARQPSRATVLPYPGASQDIGAVGVAGSATSNGDTLTVQRSGTDI